MNLEILDKALNPIRRKLTSMISLGIVRLVKDGLTQELQVSLLNGELADNVKFLEPYGITFTPREGSEVFVVNVGGNPANKVALVVGNRDKRFKDNQPGEGCIHTDEHEEAGGHHIHFKNGQIIEVHGKNIKVIASEKAEISAPIIEANGESININATGNAKVSATGSIIIGDAGNAKKVARVGDMVKVESGSSAGQWPIVTGSDKVKVS